MDENNPIEGLDPSQSAFEPLMDQTMPEGVQGMRTTTTTTMYISGAPLTPQEPMPVIGQGLKDIYDQLTPKHVYNQSDLKLRVQQILQDNNLLNTSKKVYEDENKLRKVRDVLAIEDPTGEWRDERFDDKINLTKRFPDLFPKYSEYTSGVEEGTIVKGITPDTFINKGIMDAYGQKTFSYLWDASGYGSENVDAYGKSIAYAENIQKAISDNDLKTLEKLGDVEQLKINYPSLKGGIEFVVVKDELKKDLSLEELKKLAKENPTKAGLVQPYIEKKTPSTPDYDGDWVSEEEAEKMQRMSQDGQFNRQDFDANDVRSSGYSIYRSKGRNDISFDEYVEKELYSDPVFINETIAEERNRLIPQDFFFNEEFEGIPVESYAIQDYLDIKYSKDPIQTRDNLVSYRESQKEVLEQAIKYSTQSLDMDDLVESYIYDNKNILDYEGNVKPEFIDIDNQLFDLSMSMISEKPYFNLSEDTYKRNGTTKSAEQFKRKIILEYADRPQDLMGKTYSNEEIDKMYEISEGRFIKYFGKEELDLFYYITGATKPEETNESFVLDGMISSNPKIENAIVTDDEDATVRNLNNLFSGSNFKFRVSDEGTGYDAIEIYTEVDGIEMLSSGAIFIDDNNKNYLKIVSWMANAIPRANDKKIIKDYYSNIGNLYGEQKRKAEFEFTMYALENIDKFDIGGRGAAINLQDAKMFTKDILENSFIPKEKMSLFNALLNNAQYVDNLRESKQGSTLFDVAKQKLVGGFFETTDFVRKFAEDISITFGDQPPELTYGRYLYAKDGTKRSVSEAQDMWVKDRKGKIAEDSEFITQSASGSKVKEAWLSENAPVYTQAAAFFTESFGVSLSVGGPFGSGKAGMAGFFMYGVNGLEDQMMSEDFDNLTEWEKKIISWPYGIVIGALEKLGFEGSVGAYSSGAFGKISRRFIQEALTEIPENASREVIEKAIRNSVKARFLDGSIKFVAGGISEGFVEGTQEVFDVSAKKIINKIQGFSQFKDVAEMDLTTVDGWIKLQEQVGEAAWLGMLGGGYGSGGSVALGSIRSGYVNIKSNKEFKEFYTNISNEELLETQKMHVLMKFQSEQISKEQANAEIDALDKMYSISQEIPTDLNTNQTHQAFDLLSEKRKIQEDIEGKQENLVKEQKERLKDIDRQLELISKGEYKDAIQEQETDEKVLPAKGPEVGLQEVDVQEITITEQATEEEALKSIQEENKVREKNNATPIPETEQEISKRKEELSQEKQTLKEQGEASIQETKRKEKIKKRKEEEAKQDPYKQAVEKIEEKKREIKPETSSNYANLTEDDEGNVVIYHIGPSPENMDKDSDGDVVIKPTSGKTKATSREESSALSKVGGLADFYTQESDEESMVTGDAKYAVKVPKSKVYDFNSDPEGFIEEARRRHEKEYPGMAFDANTQLAYVSQVASENGYDVVVSEWDGRTRAQSVKELKVSDTKIKEGNRVTKEFDNTYKSNKDKGYESVIPADKDDQLEDVYMKIKNEKGDNKEYDKTYFLFDSRSRKKNYNQEQITKMVNESNVSQEIKDEYNAIMEAKPEQRRSEKVRDNIAGVDIKYPTAQEEQQRKEERTKPEYVDDAANKNQTEDVESFQKELEGEFGMLTGENPLGKPLTEQENQQLNQKAEEWLKKKGYKPRKVTGKYGQAENSFFVPGLTKEDAIAFAKEFNQESVAHSDGMIFQDGTMNPRVKSNDNFAMDEYTPESDMVSVIKTEDGLKTFSVGYDFESVTEATPKPKRKKSPAKRMKQRVDRIMKQVDNAKKAISKIIPDVEIITHKDEASYRKATGETDSKKQTSRGEYNPKTKKIHINLSKANNRTVAHEVFHAILLNKLNTDKATKDLTERMIKSLSKNLEGMPEVKKALNEFAANYDENIQSEEKLAELVGILAENYGQLSKTNKSLIKRFLDRLAKMFGLKPFTDNEVVDILNTIAGKVAVGEEISDVDLKVISKNKTAEIKESNKRFQADFTDLKSGVTYSFDKNTNEFKKIEQKYITRNKSISDFNNVFMILHQPDSAFSGKISKKLSDGSEILVEGKGGIFYPIKFHEKGYFWASTSKAAQAMAESMNKAINKDGKIYMALTTAPTNKVLSSTNAANGVMNLFISLSENPKFKITDIESILIKSYNKAFGDKIDSSNNLDEIVKIIEEKLGAEKSSFNDRKTFSTSIIDSVVKSIQRKKSNQEAQNSLADFFGEGMMAEDLVTNFKKGSKISKANLTEAVSQMLTEPMLRDGKSKTENGSIYAILEIDGEVEAVDAKSETDHESYPKAIKSKGDSKTTLHLLTDRVKWNNVTIDPATGKTVNKSEKVKSKDPKKKETLVERWTQIMSPSAGVTTEAVKIDTSEITSPAKRKQKALPSRSDISEGMSVIINPRDKRNRFLQVEGAVSKILTKSETHPYGILVEIDGGITGRVQEINKDQPRKEGDRILINDIKKGDTIISEKGPVEIEAVIKTERYSDYLVLTDGSILELNRVEEFDIDDKGNTDYSTKHVKYTSKGKSAEYKAKEKIVKDLMSLGKSNASPILHRFDVDKGKGRIVFRLADNEINTIKSVGNFLARMKSKIEKPIATALDYGGVVTISNYGYGINLIITVGSTQDVYHREYNLNNGEWDSTSGITLRTNYDVSVNSVVNSIKKSAIEYGTVPYDTKQLELDAKQKKQANKNKSAQKTLSDAEALKLLRMAPRFNPIVANVFNKGANAYVLEKVYPKDSVWYPLIKEVSNYKNSIGTLKLGWLSKADINRGFDGLYNRSEILINKRSFSPDTTIAHEYLHGVTAIAVSGLMVTGKGQEYIDNLKKSISINKRSKNKIDNALARIGELYLYAAEKAGVMDNLKRYANDDKFGRVSQYGWTNIDEFIAEAFTNNTFQEELNNIKVDSKGPALKNVFNKLVQIINDLIKSFGGKGVIKNSVLEDLIRQTSDIINKQDKLIFEINQNDETQPSIRKQKGDANMEEAIQRALMKFELSAERGNTRSQAIKSAIADLKKNDWYKSATDIQRDEAIRDIKENFGIKSKKGPSTRKVLGQQKRTKVIVDQMAEYKKQIKEWNRSARLAKKDLNTRRKELGALVKSMVKGGIMTSKQAAILVERASKINLENEVIVNRFVDYAQKVFENAEYAQKFQEAISLRRKIKKNLRRDNQAEVISMGKKFADIDPQMVEDIDEYIEYADQMYEALRASRIKGLEVDFSQAANLAEMSDFYDEAIANQNKILKKEMIAKYQDLGLTEDMSIEEIREIVNAIEENEVVEGKEKEIMSFIQKRFGVMTAIAKDMIGRGVNPFTGESIDITEHQKDMINRMIKADISKMDIKNAIKFVEYMDNFITNEITSGLESAISIYEGEMSIVDLMKSKVRGRMPKLGFSEGIGELWNRQLTSLPVLFDRIFQGTNRGLKVMQKIGVQEIINGKSKKTSAHNKIMQEYSKKFIDGDKSFMNAENVYERGMVAFMSRNIVGTQTEQKVEFERRKKLVAESIDTLEKSKNRKERNKAKVYREVYNRLGIMTATDIASIKSKSSAKNLASVNWWTDQWADKYSDLADVSLSVYNTILGTDTNYTPDKYKVLSKRTDISRREVEEAANKTGAFMSGTHIDRNKSGVLMETTRPKALPKGRYVSFDFDIDNFNSMDKALTDIYTASAIQKFYGASQSSDFDEVFGDTAGLIRDRVASYIKKMKGRDEFTGNKEFNKVLNTVAKFGVSKALGGVSQALKQTFPVMANTLVNAGRFDFAQREDLAWVNESMMSIANRGIEAETAIDSADSKIDVNTSDTLRSIGKKIDSLQGMYLKAFLQAPDVYVAKSSFISYYKQYMKRKGLSTELNQGEYNQDALEYAQMMVDRQQNVSDNDLAGEFLSGSRYAMTRKVVAPFASFVLNQKARMMADLRVLNPANKAVTNEDRKAAAKSLAGLMVELTIFHTMSAAIREAFKMAAKGLFGDDDDDDKEEDEWGSLESNKKIWSAGKYAMSSVIKDILSPFPTGGDIVVDAGTNYLIDLFDINLADEDDVKKAVDAENEIRLLNREDPMSKKEISELRKSIMEQGEVKVWEDDAFLKDVGVLSIGVNTVRDLDDAYNFYKDGYYVDDKEKKRYILDRDKEDLGFVVFGKLLTAIGLAPKDIGDISRYGLKEFKNKTITEKKYEKYTEIKKEIKREPTDGELYLILNSGQDVKNVVKDIEILKKHFGGLTEKEAKEYLKLKDYKLSPSKFKIEEIKKGKTAEQIKKERRDRIDKTGDPVMRF